eukprot:TRINITY_DN8672_c0_g1_i1.p1 TRINITY_DN8672_c0_g1~~TRINITY_DN8672_c0_g1_i1.p1  ORF type:complete len:379 (+),score=92.37 TRINITY_DN8672_c0_g1_i1:190-1326(+)
MEYPNNPFSAKSNVACYPCRMRHVACDFGRPCSRCQQKNIECLEPETRKRGPKSKKLGDISSNNNNNNSHSNSVEIFPSQSSSFDFIYSPSNVDSMMSGIYSPTNVIGSNLNAVADGMVVNEESSVGDFNFLWNPPTANVVVQDPNAPPSSPFGIDPLGDPNFPYIATREMKEEIDRKFKEHGIDIKRNNSLIEKVRTKVEQLSKFLTREQFEKIHSEYKEQLETLKKASDLIEFPVLLFSRFATIVHVNEPFREFTGWKVPTPTRTEDLAIVQIFDKRTIRQFSSTPQKYFSGGKRRFCMKGNVLMHGEKKKKGPEEEEVVEVLISVTIRTDLFDLPQMTFCHITPIHTDMEESFDPALLQDEDNAISQMGKTIELK